MKKLILLICVLSFNFSILNAFADSSVDILYIGDSHGTGPFGKQLYSELSKNHSTALYSVSGSKPSSWLPGKSNKARRLCSGSIVLGPKAIDSLLPKGEKCVNTPELPNLLNKHKPKLVVIQQGSNLIGWPASYVKEKVNALLGLLDSGTPCVWIAAPDARGKHRGPKAPKGSDADKPHDLNQDEVNDLLEKLVANRCAFFKTASELEKDGLHYPEKGGGGVHYDYGKTSPKHYKEQAKAYVDTWVSKSAELVEKTFPPAPSADTTDKTIKRSRVVK